MPKILYNVNRKLGQGDYGFVCHGTFSSDDAGKPVIEVAVKRVQLTYTLPDTQHREGDALRKLDHPNVVKFYGEEEQGEFK